MRQTTAAANSFPRYLRQSLQLGSFAHQTPGEAQSRRVQSVCTMLQKSGGREHASPKLQWKKSPRNIYLLIDSSISFRPTLSLTTAAAAALRAAEVHLSVGRTRQSQPISRRLGSLTWNYRKNALLHCPLHIQCPLPLPGGANANPVNCFCSSRDRKRNYMVAFGGDKGAPSESLTRL